VEEREPFGDWVLRSYVIDGTVTLHNSGFRVRYDLPHAILVLISLIGRGRCDRQLPSEYG
jgi:hypothetical protein